ncbi:MAG: SUMF1/EgtB/PvdO family nonheme iron enzyme [Chlorobiaceae bacterium]|nr:SUMF1/EgtB/PvdO family nonheme iron enzyme [Chlorobiaceae bacterium]
MSVTWLHVSDFHLSDRGPYNQAVILRALVSSVKRFREEESRVPDLIFATGDIAQSGKENEYEQATKFFDDLLDAAGLNRDRLFVVPGNHDVDRKMGKFLLRTLDNKDDADEFFDPDTPLPNLTQKFHAFSEWYNDYFNTIRTFPTNTTCSSVEIININNITIAVLPLNSALFCIDEHDHEKLFIGRRCLDKATSQFGAADLKIAFIHHPLNWLSSVEQRNIRTSLVESVDLLLQGHFHEAVTESIVSANGEYLKLAAGAAYQTRQYPNTAMYGTFDGHQVSIFPIRYEDAPREVWTLDTSLFPAPSYIKSYPLPGRTLTGVITVPTPTRTLHAESKARYQATLRAELGYIRMLGLPGIESIKVNLNDDTFVPLRLSGMSAFDLDNPEKGDTRWPEHILYPDEIMKRAFHDGRKLRMLLVIGDPGAGKTTLLKYYALCVIEDYRRLGFLEPLNVFYLPLRELIRDKDGYSNCSLPENLSAWSGKHHQTLDAEFFDDWISSAPSLVLLDGLDEISDTTERKEVCEWIDNAWSGFSKAYFVVTSRATGYNKDEGIELEADYERADVQDFTPEQQERFLLNWFTAAFLKEPREKEVDEATWQADQKEEAIERTRAIVEHLKSEKNKGLRQLAAIPMLLQIMAILWKDRDYMPESRVKLYDASLDYLLEFRDKRRKIKPLLSATHARQVLAPIALWMHEVLKNEEVAKDEMHTAMQEGLENLDAPPTAEDFCDYLVKRAGLLVDSAGKEYLFRHKSFREYLTSVQLKEDGPYEHLDTLVAHFGEDWWEEPLRFFIASVDVKVFDAFMEKLFDLPQSQAFTQKQQFLLQTIIEEAKGKKIDALCKKLLDPVENTTAERQRAILDCLKTIGKTAALNSLNQFRAKRLAKNRDVAGRVEEVILAFGGQPSDQENERLIGERLIFFSNKNEQNAIYIWIPGGRFLYSATRKEEYVSGMFFGKYPVTNRLYRSFIIYLQSQENEHEALLPVSRFVNLIQDIANGNTWDTRFCKYLNESRSSDLAGLFRSEYDQDRKFGGNEQPVVGISWYAAKAYCLWLSLLESGGEKYDLYRLPTEIEWEWVATGKEQRFYPWGDIDPLSRLANYGHKVGATTPVGSYPKGATPQGLYDMAGNVWEWMDGLFDKKMNRALRGGSWSNNAGSLRCSARNYFYPSYWYYYVGFRVVRPGLAVEP